MPQMSDKFVPKHKGDKNPNPKLLKFVRHVTDRIPGKIKMTTDAPEYWGLACIFEDEMDAVTREASLDLLLDMLPGNFFKVRKHHTYAQLHGMNAEKHYTPDDKSFDELLDKLAYLRYDLQPRGSYLLGADVCAGKCRIYEHEHRADGSSSGVSDVLRANDIPALGEDYADGADGWKRYRYARHSGGKSHLDGKSECRYRAHQLLA